MNQSKRTDATPKRRQLTPYQLKLAEQIIVNTNKKPKREAPWKVFKIAKG